MPADKLKKELQTYFDACIRAFEFSGAISVSYKGKRIWVGTSGYANREHRVPNSAKTKFRLASITKPFTAIAIMQLQEQGKLEVSEPVSKYLKQTPRHWKKITVHHLLTHTSGIPSYTEFPDHDGAIKTTPAQLLASFKDKSLQFNPGEKFAYCNSGYVLLGILIETLSRQSYADFLRENIFEPAGMMDTGVDDNALILSKRAQGYVRSLDNVIINADYIDMSQPYSAGALYSTIDDLRLWNSALANGQLLSRASMKAMLKPEKDGYASGWAVHNVDRRIAIGHAGGINGFTTNIECIQKEGFCSIVLSNIESAPVSLIADGIRSVVFATPYMMPQKYKAVKIDSAGLSDFEGQYELEPGFIISVFCQDGRLIAQANGQDKLRLLPLSANRFFFFQIYATVTFCRDRKKTVTHLILHQNGKDLEAKKIPP